MWVRLERCLYGQVVWVGYIPSSLGRYVLIVYGHSGILVWGRNGIDMVKDDRVIFIVRSLVRDQTCIDGTIFAINFLFKTSFTRSTINWFDRTTLG